jgi:hypothetical protein
MIMNENVFRTIIEQQRNTVEHVNYKQLIANTVLFMSSDINENMVSNPMT